VNVSLLIRQRLAYLGLDQKDLAAAAQVTESYISQLLARKKAPPSPKRTDIYEKIGKALKVPRAQLAKLADLERNEAFRKRVSEVPRPLFEACREMIVRKCDLARRNEVQRIFEKEPFGELERLVTQKLLDFAQGIAREELKREEWLRLMAQHSGRSYAQVRVSILEFLDVDVFSISVENCISFLDPIIDAWDIDLKSFGLSFVPNRRFTAAGAKRFEFAEQNPPEPAATEPGLEQFLRDRSLSGDVTGEEVAFLKALKLRGKRPSPIYYYRELQNLRDPLHFPSAAQSRESE
jgi:transcriptional regulator with XRE-family HTH domain